MPKKEDQGEKPTHYATNHATGPFPAGAVVAAPELHAILGVKDNATEPERARAIEEGMARLVKLGAITPAPAPEEPAEVPAPDPEAERLAHERAMAEARREATQPPKAPDDPRKSEGPQKGK